MNRSRWTRYGGHVWIDIDVLRWNSTMMRRRFFLEGMMSRGVMDLVGRVVVAGQSVARSTFGLGL